MASKKQDKQAEAHDRLVTAATAVLPILNGVPQNDPGQIEAVQELRAAIDDAGGDVDLETQPQETVEG